MGWLGFVAWISSAGLNIGDYHVTPEVENSGINLQFIPNLEQRNSVGRHNQNENKFHCKRLGWPGDKT